MAPGNRGDRPGQAPSVGRRLQGLLRRLAAIAYDGLILAGLWLVAGGVTLLFPPDWLGTPRGRHLTRVLLLAVAAVFFGYFWTHGGQTLGMRAWRLRLVGPGGGPVGWGRALWRVILALVSWLPLGAGYWWVLLDRQGRAWHDRLSGTRLVWLPEGDRGR